MLCENCRKDVASVHLSGWQTVRIGSTDETRGQPFEHHFCATCAEELRQSNPLLNPLLQAPQGARVLKLRVTNVSPERIEVRAINPPADWAKDQWSFLAYRLPPRYAVLGME